MTVVLMSEYFKERNTEIYADKFSYVIKLYWYLQLIEYSGKCNNIFFYITHYKDLKL